MLAHASEIDENFARCPGGCGGYADECLTTDGAHVVDTFFCDRRRAMEQYQAEGADREPGVIAFPVLAELKRDRPAIQL